MNISRSTFDHVPSVLGWEVNTPEFAKKSGKLEYVKFALKPSGLTLCFVGDEGDASFYTQSYDQSQGNCLVEGFYYEETEPEGFLMGFPYLIEAGKERSWLGVEICGDPNDIYNTNATFVLNHISSFYTADSEQVRLKYDLENEIACNTPDYETRFFNPDPVVYDSKSSAVIRKPMSVAERDELRVQLPFTFKPVRPSSI